MKLLIALLLTLSVSAYGQTSDSLYVEQLKKEKNRYIVDGSMKLGVGIFVHIMGCLTLANSNSGDPNVIQPFIIYNTTGIFFDVMGWMDFKRAKEKKKEIKVLEEFEKNQYLPKYRHNR